MPVCAPGRRGTPGRVRVIHDPRGLDRPWQLDPIPLVISARESELLQRGLVQRARLLEAILADLRQVQGLAIRFDGPALEKLRDACLADLSNGGRGVRNKIEAHLLNPLARALFDLPADAGRSLDVVDIEIGQVTTLRLEKSAG